MKLTQFDIAHQQIFQVIKALGADMDELLYLLDLYVNRKMQNNRLILLISGDSLSSITTFDACLRALLPSPLKSIMIPCTTFDLDKVRSIPNIGAIHIGVHGLEPLSFYDQVRDLAFTKNRLQAPFATPQTCPPINVVLSCQKSMLKNLCRTQHTQNMHLIMLDKPKVSDTQLKTMLKQSLSELKKIEFMP